MWTLDDRISVLELVVLLIGTTLVGSCSQLSAAAEGGDRTTKSFRLGAEDTHFVMDGERDPTLRVDRGDRVRITFENTQPGVHHAIAVPPFTDGTYEVASGDTTTVTFVASETGTYEYTCPHHAPFMEGKLVVAPDDPNSSN